MIYLVAEIILYMLAIGLIVATLNALWLVVQMAMAALFERD